MFDDLWASCLLEHWNQRSTLIRPRKKTPTWYFLTIFIKCTVYSRHKYMSNRIMYWILHCQIKKAANKGSNEQRVRAPSCSGPDYKTHIYENKIAKSWISALASLFSVQIHGNCWLKLKRSSVRLVKTELSFLHKSFSSLKSRRSEELHVLAQPKNWEFEEWK